MSNVILSFTNQVDQAGVVLSSSATLGDNAPQNMTDPIIGRRCRLSGGTGYVQFDFGANKTIDVVCLVFPRDTAFPTSGTITHAFDANGGTPGAGAAHDSGAVAIGTYEGYGYHFYAPSVSARYWRATFNTSSSFVDIGRAWAGQKFQPEINVPYGYLDVWEDRSRITATERSGAEYVDHKPLQRGFSFGLQHLSESERQTVREGLRKIGRGLQMLACLDPDSPGRETMIGRQNSIQAMRASYFQRFETSIELRESL